MYGENDINHMNLNELQALESNLEIWVHNIRYTKVSYISFSAQTKIFSELIIFNILPLSAEQMQIISREIKMLKTKVHKWDFLNLWKYEQSSSLLQCLFVAMFCRKAYWRMPMIYSKKGYYTLTQIHLTEPTLFEMLPFDFRIAEQFKHLDLTKSW